MKKFFSSIVFIGIILVGGWYYLNYNPIDDPNTDECKINEELINGVCIIKDDPINSTGGDLEKAVFVKEDVQDSVLKIVATYHLETYFSSGVVIHKDSNKYFLVTTSYLVDDSDSIVVIFEDGSQEEGQLEGVDPYTTLAIVSFTSSKNIDVVPLHTNEDYEPDDIVISVGNFEDSDRENPLDQYVIVDTYTTSPFNNLYYFGEGYIHHNLTINDYNNGGGLFNLDGALIGLNTNTFSITGGPAGYAIPAVEIEKVASFLMNGIPVERPGLWYDYAFSVSMMLEDPTTYSEYILPTGVIEGVYITDVYDNGIMNLAGIMANDIIISIDGVAVNNESFMRYQLYYNHSNDDDITFVINRGGVEMTLTYDHTLYTSEYYTYRHIYDEMGNEYYGEYYGDDRNGFGITYYLNGDIKDAYYYGDEEHGITTIYHFNGNLSEAEYDTGVLISTIQLWLVNGDYYEGEIVNGTPHGEGILWKANGDTYQGTFINGLMEGFGYKWFANEDYYEGNFALGTLNGYGTMYYANGTAYQGNFASNLRHGVGIFWYYQHLLFYALEANFVNDNPIGMGTLYFNGTAYLYANFVDWNNTTNGILYDPADGSSSNYNLVNGMPLPY